MKLQFSSDDEDNSSSDNEDFMEKYLDGNKEFIEKYQAMLEEKIYLPYYISKQTIL